MATRKAKDAQIIGWGYQLKTDEPERQILFVTRILAIRRPRFGTFLRCLGRETLRWCDPSILPRSTFAAAQKDLDAYAEKHRLARCCAVCGSTDDDCCWPRPGLCWLCAAKWINDCKLRACDIEGGSAK